MIDEQDCGHDGGGLYDTSGAAARSPPVAVGAFDGCDASDDASVDAIFGWASELESPLWALVDPLEGQWTPQA